MKIKVIFLVASILLAACSNKKPDQVQSHNLDKDLSAQISSEKRMSDRGCSFNQQAEIKVECIATQDLYVFHTQVASIALYLGNTMAHLNNKTLSDLTRIGLVDKSLASMDYLLKLQLKGFSEVLLQDSKPKSLQAMREYFFSDLRILAISHEVVVDFELDKPDNHANQRTKVTITSFAPEQKAAASKLSGLLFDKLKDFSESTTLTEDEMSEAQFMLATVEAILNHILSKEG